MFRRCSLPEGSRPRPPVEDHEPPSRETKPRQVGIELLQPIRQGIGTALPSDLQLEGHPLPTEVDHRVQPRASGAISVLAVPLWLFLYSAGSSAAGFRLHAIVPGKNASSRPA